MWRIGIVALLERITKPYPRSRELKPHSLKRREAPEPQPTTFQYKQIHRGRLVPSWCERIEMPWETKEEKNTTQEGVSLIKRTSTENTTLIWCQGRDLCNVGDGKDVMRGKDEGTEKNVALSTREDDM